jgi:peptidoglycan/LPS O-acetylase OafA/YrhL
MIVRDRPDADARMPALDGLRGVAVLAVIAYHVARRFPEPTGPARWLAEPATFGWAGVDLFFVLSGFLITGILYDRLGSRGYFRAFYGRRALRILPLHLSALAALVVGYAAFGGPRLGPLLESMPWHVAFLTNVRVSLAESWSAAPHGTSHLWSLAVEEQFYLLWPLVVVLVARASPAAPRRALLWLCLGVAAAAVVMRSTILHGMPLAAYTLFPARMDALAAGAGVALWVRGPGGMAPALAASGPVLVASGIGLTAIGAAGPVEPTMFDPLQRSVGYSLWAVFFAAVVVRAAAAGDAAAVLCRGPLAWAGRISFGLYVLHFPVLSALAAAGARELGPLLFTALVVGITTCLAWASWVCIERPALRLKYHFRYEPVPA